GTEVCGSSLSTSNVIRKGSNASWRTSLNHKLCGLRRMDTMLPLLAKVEFTYQVELDGKAGNASKPQ
ncbi:hypothetical protein, partial [Rhizobium sp. PP-CC-3G-465]|uniref:hypothetical protein n=1 Tax=Rhizobium sp. PP-CC-3G-465 TaxID=2135648 RepID=UPI001A9E7951